MVRDFLNKPHTRKKRINVAPLQAIVTQRGGRGIPLTHAQFRRYIGVSGQCHAPVALPTGKRCGQEAGWDLELVLTGVRRKSLAPTGVRTPNRVAITVLTLVYCLQLSYEHRGFIVLPP